MKVATLSALLTPPVIAWHGYMWHRIFRATGMSIRTQRLGAAAFALLAVTTILAAARPRWLGSGLKEVVCAVGFPWIGFAILFAFALALAEIPRALAWWRAKRGRGPADPARRRTLERVLGGVAAAAGTGAALAGAAEALALTVQRVRVPLARLPAALSGLRIVQISDLHFGAAVGPDYLDRVIAAAAALDPDLVAITGDLVDGSVPNLGRDIARLRTLRPRHGIFFVTGNHEYYSGVVPWIEHLTSLGIRVLRNERVVIGGPEASFDLAGIDDMSARDWGHGHGHDLPRALAGRDPTRELLLLAHQPAAVREASRLGVGLQLSGHTHGGQIWPIRFLLYIDHPFVDGLHRMGETWIYVSRGAGYWGPPMRVGAPPEIAEITLVSGGAGA